MVYKTILDINDKALKQQKKNKPKPKKIKKSTFGCYAVQSTKKNNNDKQN